MRLTAPPRSTSISSLLILPVPLGLLVIAYLVALSRRPSIPESAQIDDPHQWGFPKWYGNNPTPYDFEDLSLGGEEETCDHPKKVLLFIDNSTQIPSALTLSSSLSSSTRFNLTTISTFSPEWNTELSAKQNLLNFGCKDAEWIWRVGDHSDEKDLGCQKAIWIEEGVHKPGRANISLLSQPHHMVKGENAHSNLKAIHGDGWNLGLLSHVLPAVSDPSSYNVLRIICASLIADNNSSRLSNPTIFHPTRRISSRRSVVYFPSETTDKKDYPKLPWGRSWSIYAPSQRKVPIPKKDEDSFSSQSAWRKYWHREEERLANTMRHAGICLFEGWTQGELDDRIAKAMLSGCVVATVPPQAHHDAFSPLILPLSKSPSVALQPQLPVEELQHFQSTLSTAELQKIALKAFITARNRLIPLARLKAVENTVRIWEDGGRGYDFKDGFRWDCDTGHGGWCE
ncbi:uncharacterized protein L201_003135 [Kwoniella dendrophila CBS 6074]|uniref:Exostosin GT47 domain-containing protein n=1 Tax=Kwoniella dendrophila CBS 6074 TaxID=1295534 RepID=A0AAX4JUK1_9TREE